MDYNSEEMQTYFSYYVGEKYETYYNYVWKNKYNEKIFFRFNVCAFLFGYLWYFYRKMYIEGIVFIAIAFVFNRITESIFGNIQIFDTSSNEFFSTEPIKLVADYFQQIIRALPVTLASGFLGNFLYLKNIKRNIKALLNKNSNDKIIIYLANRKSTNKEIVIILIIIFVIMPIVVLLLLALPLLVLAPR